MFVSEVLSDTTKRRTCFFTDHTDLTIVDFSCFAFFFSLGRLTVFARVFFSIQPKGAFFFSLKDGYDGRSSAGAACADLAGRVF